VNRGRTGATGTVAIVISRFLLLAGAAGMAVATVLTWVTISGIGLDLGPLGTEVSPGAQTVRGIDTSLWPFILGAAAVVAILGLIGVARKLLVAIGLVVVAGGGALLYYLSNVIEIESSGGGAIEKAITEALISSSVGPGAPVLVAAGIVIVAGALLS
jgi:hypothetical protein